MNSKQTPKMIWHIICYVVDKIIDVIKMKKNSTPQQLEELATLVNISELRATQWFKFYKSGPEMLCVRNEADTIIYRQFGKSESNELFYGSIELKVYILP